ncbi:MAG TPA: DUF4129 domain-containing protein [Anaerolineae bacterium]|nr:DUF4129 domain-containing protein [Anaerolineae bacterium]
MRHLTGPKYKYAAFLFLLAAVFSLLILSSGLSATEVSTEWQSFNLDDSGIQPIDANALNELLARLSDIPNSILQALYFSLIIIVPIAIVFAILSPEMRKGILHELKRALSLAIRVAAFAYLFRLWQQRDRNLQNVSGGGGLPATPDWIREPSAAIAFGLTLLLLAVIIGAAWFLWRKLRPEPLDLLAREAQTTITELQMGRDFKNSIIECYANMCRVLHQERKLVRAQAMTPREFSVRLERFGVVGPQAHRLTRLFEKVRYGRHQPTDQDKADAIACLEAIVQAAKQ